MKKTIFAIALLLIPVSAFAMLQPKSQYLQYVQVAAAGTAQQLSATSEKFYDLTVCANSGNSGIVVVGSSTVLANINKRTGIALSAGQCYTFTGNSPDMINGDLSDYYVDAVTSNDRLHFVYRVQK